MTGKTCFHHGKISYDSGLKLEMLDENSLKYYVEELKEELDREKLRTQEKDKELSEKNADIDKLKKELDALKAQLATR